MATDAKPAAVEFDPGGFSSFRFLARELSADGRVTLRYALDDTVTFLEEFDLPVAGAISAEDRRRLEGPLSLLHWVAGVSYFKTAIPAAVSCETGAPPAAVADLLEALYSEGLGEFAYSNHLRELPRPRFPRASAGAVPAAPPPPSSAHASPRRVLVPVGGGKDSAVALEIVRRSGLELALFSIGEAPAIAGTIARAELPHLLVRRRLDPGLARLNSSGALNGHVPVTAIVACAAVLTAALHGFDSVAMANERSASSGNLRWDRIEVNHQFSKGLAAERLMRAALAELAIARAFARLERYHGVFTSCNAVFRSDPDERAESWCCDCPKCRFVFLMLAPFSDPAHLRGIFGRDLLEDEGQFEGFALLSGSAGPKPFECVGEEQESIAAIRMLAADPRWSTHPVVARLAEEVLPRHPPDAAETAVLALEDDHEVPAALLADVRALLGA